MKRPVDTMTITGPVGSRVVSGTGTYVDGSVYFGSAEFEAERGETFAEFMVRMETEPAPAGEPAEFFTTVRKGR